MQREAQELLTALTKMGKLQRELKRVKKPEKLRVEMEIRLQQRALDRCYGMMLMVGAVEMRLIAQETLEMLAEIEAKKRPPKATAKAAVSARVKEKMAV